ncbi:hypothetical protein HYH03_009991 [Edaphochlamys debaryana]|uniref:Uncharacterized protein n=1 Tax=Edaphochlamys debaryana TaxID=47281 RepID=A0A836BWL3_9CHLO|nr:hypothetical protein HYH03_009991 [Edaphochlamys debaryana]|eukprot:KAG2491620.1 hypothetical protein HYH03_009991 [Edaphochlamys debaryana]
MQWLPCSAASADAAVTTARFGHTAACISGTGSVWGTDLVVVFGGVSYSPGAPEPGAPGSAGGAGGGGGDLGAAAAGGGGGAGSQLEHHAALGDVVVLQAEADMWFAPQVSGSPDYGCPEARAFHCAAAVDRRMYVFGGHVLSYDQDQNKKRRRFFNDLWCLDTDTWTWQRLDPGPGPGAVPGQAPEQPPRRDMATLTRAGPGCLLLFGGRLESGRVAGDAWILDLATHTWSQLRIPGPSPPPRKMHAAVYATNRVVIFGGERDAGVLDDLWTLKGADPAAGEPARWTLIRLRPAPAGRFGHAMAACGSRLAVFGGCLDQSSLLSFTRNYVQCNELWVLDMATFSWHRVDPPEGVTALSGAALDDPALAHSLGAMQGDKQLLLLPVERMCHSLVAGAGGRLLLAGGRKRDGICAESWWLSMGPDNLTPTLTVPPPATVAAALRSGLQAPPRAPGPQPSAHAAPHAAHPAPASPTPTAAAAAAATAPASHAGATPGAPPAPTAAAATGTLLQNLLMRRPGQPGPPGAQAPPPPPAGPGHAHSHSYPTAASGGPSLGGSGVGPSLAGSGSALDALASSTLVPIDGPGPGPTGPLLLDPGYPGAQAKPTQPASAAPTPSPLSASALAAAAAATPAAAASAAGAAGAALLSRLTTKVSTLLGPAGPTPGPASGPAPAGSGGPSPGPSLSTSPGAAGAGSGLLARFRPTGSSTNLTGPTVAQPGPGQAQAQAHMQAQGRQAAGVAVAGGGGARSQPQQAQGAAEPLQQLRARLGLAPLPPPAAGSSSASVPPPQPPPPATTPPALEPLAALASMGRALAAQAGGAEGGPEGAGAGGDGRRGRAAEEGAAAAAAAVARARRHLACCAPEQLRVGDLPLLLADCQALLKERSCGGWATLVEEARGDLPSNSSNPSSAAPSSAAPSPSPPLDLGVLAALLASHAHPLAGLGPEGLRLGDVGELLGAYRGLVLSAPPGGAVTG